MELNFLKSPTFWIFAVLVVGIGGYSYVFEELPAEQDHVKKDTKLSALLASTNEALYLDVKTKSADCKLQGPLPDHACGPGAVFENATVDIICVHGYSKTVRSVSTNTRKKVFEEYGIAWPQPFGSYEVDHIIPLAIGGSNDMANLFPEARVPQPGFQEKDVVENYLHEQVCAGDISLDVAQARIASDWVAIYNGLSEETVKMYKAKYKSWAPNE